MAATRTSTNETIDAAHAALIDAVEQLVTGSDYQHFLALAARFTRYSANNQLLLAAQGAAGTVASYKRWTTIPAVDGEPCRIRRGEKAVRVYAPVHSTRRETDPDTGDDRVVSRAITRFRLVPVFHEGQLQSPPAWPAQPELLTGGDTLGHIWGALDDLAAGDGFTVVRRPIVEHPGANGLTNFDTQTVVVRDDVDLAQAVKTLLHELGHVRLHNPDRTDPETTVRSRAVIEVEAESVAYLVASALQLDSSGYTIPYVAHWAAGDTAVVRATAERSLAAAKTLVGQLETVLDIDLTRDPLDQITANATVPTGTAAPSVPTNETVAESAERVVTQGSSPDVAPGGDIDARVIEHLAHGFNWYHLVNTFHEIDRDHAANAATAADRAQVLADAGVTTAVAALVLAAGGHRIEETVAALTHQVDDIHGDRTPLYPPDEITDAVTAAYQPQPAAHSSAGRTVGNAGGATSEVAREQYARTILLNAIDTATAVAGLAGLSQNPVDAIRYTEPAHNRPALLAGLLTHYQLTGHVAAGQLNLAAVPIDQAIKALDAISPTVVDALVAMRAGWPGHSDQGWITWARTALGDRPDLPTNLPPLPDETAPSTRDSAPAFATPVGDPLIASWAAIDHAATAATPAMPGVDLVAAWAQHDTPPSPAPTPSWSAP